MSEAKKIPYVLGIDLGANSIGWAVLDCEVKEDDQPEITDIRRAGARVFEAGTEGDVESGKDESRAKKRRSARLIRRQLNRRAMRTFDLYQRLQKKGMLPAIKPEEESLDAQRAARDPALAKLDREILKRWTEKLKKKGADEDAIRLLAKKLPYILRARALDEKLPIHELGRALYHLGQRRGFQSNRKAGKKDDEESGKVKAGIKELNEQITGARVRTLGELYARTNPEEKRIRQRWTSRDMYKHEFEEIWKAQNKYYPELLTDDFKKEIFDTIFSQRPLKSQSHLIGKCEHEPGNKRAPIASLTFQRFRILQNVNNLRITSEGITRGLTDSEKKKIISALEEEGDLTFGKIKSKELLGLKKRDKFTLEKGNQKGLIGNRTSLALKGIFKEKWEKLSEDEREVMVEDIMSMEDDDALKRRAMKAWGLNEPEAKDLSELELEPDYCNLSKKAMKKLIPLMENGNPYMTAVAKVYDPPPPEPEDSLIPVRNALKELRNPVVERSLTEMRKVVNAVIREYGKPEMVRVELARDIRNPRKRRKELNEQNKKNQKAREKARDEILKAIKNLKVSRRDELKYLLAEECNWECPYTGKKINVNSLFGMNPRFDVEHIIPFSRCQDNSFMNKTLADAEWQRNVKGNKTPWEACASDEEKYDRIIERVKKFSGDAKDAKLRRFLMKDEELKDYLSNFSSRQLNDTRYASKLAVKYLSRLYGASGLFKTEDGKMTVMGVDEKGRRRVQVCAGGVTAHIRNELGLRTIWNSILEEAYPKIDEEDETEESLQKESFEKERIDHRHHAIDAIAIGLASPSMVKKLADAAKRATKEKRRLYAKMDAPWPSFLDDFREQSNKIIVSHRASKKVTGPLHQETYYGKPRKDEQEKLYVHKREKLETLSAKDVENIVDPIIKQTVKKKLNELGGDAKKFKETANHPFLKTKDGRKIPIHKVRIKKYVTTEKIGTGPKERNVIPGSNHHIEYFEIKDKNGKPKWEAVIITTRDSMQRLREKKPIIGKDNSKGGEFLFSLSQGEIIELDEMDANGNKSGTRGMYVVRSMSYVRQGGKLYPNIAFVRLNDARLKKNIEKTGDFKTGLPEPLRKLNLKKVSIDPIGQIRAAND
ncbi:MAG TPA: type II CRISPR RNA-guided endonuclease Cas9 [bacterium]|nr:type II CRISPR RNA-guided endonuclease Cas9 [bacterium]